MEPQAAVNIDKIRAIVARAGSASDPLARIDAEIESLLRTSTGDLLERHYREYVIQICLGDGLRQFASELASIQPLEISAAPQLLTLLPYAEGDVLVGSYWACPDEDVISVDDSNVRFSRDARDRFRRDMEKLAEHGKMHAYAGRGFRHWWVGARSGTIVLGAWSTALTDCSPRDRVRLLASVDELLARRAQI